jgi:MFS transporter, DHA3 family, tetracycline resistance protein
LNKLGAYRVYLILSCFSAMFFMIMATYNIVYQNTIVGLNALQLVLVGTLLELTAFLGEIPTGIVADMYSRRLSVIIGVFLIGAGFTIEGAIPRFEAVLLSQVIWGLGATFVSGAQSAWITDEVGEENVGRIFMRGAQMGQVGGLIGVLIGTALATTIAVNVPVIVGGLLHIALAGFLVLFMPETGFTPTPRGERSTWGAMIGTFRDGVRVVRVRPVLLTLLLVGLFIGMSSEGYDRLWQKNLIDGFVLPAIDGMNPLVWFGIISVVGSLLSIAATEIVRRRVDTSTPEKSARALIVISTLQVAGVIAFAFAGHFALAFAAILLIDVTRSIQWPISDAWMNQHIDSKVRATVLSMGAQLNAVGQIGGGPAVGWIGLRVSVRAAIFTSGLLLTPILALYARTLRRDQVVEEAAV